MIGALGMASNVVRRRDRVGAKGTVRYRSVMTLDLDQLAKLPGAGPEARRDYSPAWDWNERLARTKRAGTKRAPPLGVVPRPGGSGRGVGRKYSGHVSLGWIRFVSDGDVTIAAPGLQPALAPDHLPAANAPPCQEWTIVVGGPDRDRPGPPPLGPALDDLQ